jgi:hypothetical protein
MEKRRPDRQDPFPSDQKKAKSDYFSKQLIALWKLHPELGSFESFSRLVGVHPTTISKIVGGKAWTTDKKVIGLYLPAFIALGVFTNADEARRLIEPPFHLLKREEL